MIEGISNFIDLITHHGIFKIFITTLLVCSTIVLFKASGQFDINSFVNEFHKVEASVSRSKQEFRRESDNILKETLNKILIETNASHTSIIELHNGKSNLSGLGFYYADMTYEVVAPDFGERIILNFGNINLSGIEIDDVLFKSGFGYGTIEDLKEVDPVLGFKIEENGTEGILLLLLEEKTETGDIKELGVLEVSFNRVPTNIEIERARRIMLRERFLMTARLSYK